MSALNGAVIVASLGATLGLSAWLARCRRTPADDYVGGRTLPCWALALSILAAAMSSLGLVGYGVVTSALTVALGVR